MWPITQKFCALLGPNLQQIVWLTEERVPENAAFGTHSQAAQSRGLEPNAPFLRALLRPDIIQKVGLTGCQGVSGEAAFGTRNQAAQPRGSAPNAPFFKAHFWLTIGGPTRYKSGGYWLLKVPEKAAFCA